MAEDPPLTVIVSPTASSELWEIWQYNAERYNFHHAEGYEAFVMAGINALATTYAEGKGVEGFPNLRSLTLKRRRRGDGHVVIYEVDATERTVNVHHVYHTKNDIQGRLEGERN
jgi:plasmid stabilization system protein ParE